MSSLLDIRTLILVLTGVVFVQALLLLCLWRFRSQYPPARYWGGGALVGGVGLLLTGLRGLVPDALSVLIATLLLLTGWALFCAGIVSAAEKTPPWRSGGLVIAVTLFVNTWFLWANPDFFVRVFVFNLAMLLFNVYTLLVCLTVRAGTRTATLRVIGIAMLLVTASGLWRTAGVFREDVTVLLTPDFAQVQFFCVLILFFSSVTCMLVMLAAQKLQDEISALARHDTLTQAYNRLAFDELAVKEIARARRHRSPLSFLMLDIDHFKAFNDRFGHRAGDAALCRISRLAQQALRPEDVWCRYGGEEFVALLPNTDAAQAQSIAERLRRTVQQMTDNEAGEGMTVSIGVVEADAAGCEWKDAVDQADRAMYQAKSAGRNRVVVAPRLAATLPQALPAGSPAETV